jgi:hypothetical protein
MKDFNEDIKIDKNNLTEELLRQPQLFYKWAKEAGHAQVDTAVVKDKLELTKAEIETRIRANPSIYDLPNKPTEAMVKAKALLNRKVKRATKEYHEKLRVEKILLKAERSFEHRKKSLEGLVYRSNQLYFADPKTDQNTRKNIDEMELISFARKKRNVRRRREK